MSFWSIADRKDPKRAYRWILISNSIPKWILKKTQKPSFEVTESAHKYINHTFYYPGRVEWKEISISVADPVDPDAAALLVEIIRNSGYTPATDENMLSTISKRNAVNSLGHIEIQQIDSEGNWVEKWTLYNAWVKDVKFGELDYESDDMTEVELTLRYDFAWLQTKNSEGLKEFWRPGAAN